MTVHDIGGVSSLSLALAEPGDRASLALYMFVRACECVIRAWSAKVPQMYSKWFFPLEILICTKCCAVFSSALFPSFLVGCFFGFFLFFLSFFEYVCSFSRISYLFIVIILVKIVVTNVTKFFLLACLKMRTHSLLSQWWFPRWAARFEHWDALLMGLTAREILYGLVFEPQLYVHLPCCVRCVVLCMGIFHICVYVYVMLSVLLCVRVCACVRACAFARVRKVTYLCVCGVCGLYACIFCVCCIFCCVVVVCVV